MATAEQIEIVRLNIDDLDSEDFTDGQISAKIDDKSSINWACWQLLEILRVRLRKAILKRDTTGNESTEVQSLQERLALYGQLIDKYKNDYYDELGFGTGRMISTNKPTIAGGDI
jgi:hypothetical protein